MRVSVCKEYSNSLVSGINFYPLFLQNNFLDKIIRGLYMTSDEEFYYKSQVFDHE